MLYFSTLLLCSSFLLYALSGLSFALVGEIVTPLRCRCLSFDFSIVAALVSAYVVALSFRCALRSARFELRFKTAPSFVLRICFRSAVRLDSLVTSQKFSKRFSVPNALVRIVCLLSASLTTDIYRSTASRTQPLIRVVKIGFGGSFLIRRNALIICGEPCYSVLILELFEILLVIN